MKLISVFFTKMTLAVATLITMSVFTHARMIRPADGQRVFWNRFEVISGDDNTVVLTWNVTEYNNKSFLVQHSMNGSDWETITIIHSKNSAETMVDYSYTHRNKLNGKQFYRIQDVDVDTKTINFSPVKTLTLQNDNTAIMVWPNPVVTHLFIANNNKSDKFTKAQIFDLSGKLVSEKQLQTNTNAINVEDLSAGNYIVKIASENGTVLCQKIVKQ